MRADLDRAIATALSRYWGFNTLRPLQRKALHKRLPGGVYELLVTDPWNQRAALRKRHGTDRVRMNPAPNGVRRGKYSFSAVKSTGLSPS